jgi:alkylhydroperoxidase family enzyme
MNPRTLIETIAPADALGALQSMYLRQQRAWGYVPNYARIFCYRPEVMARWGQLLAEIKRPMDKRRFELVTFVAAHELHHTACALAHGQKLREFFTEAQILAIAEGRLEGVLGEAAQAIVGFARRIARDASSVSADEIAALKQHGYTDAELFDIAATAAGRAFFTKLLDALGVTADSALIAGSDAFREKLTLGRGIDEHECVAMAVSEPEPTQWESG